LNWIQTRYSPIRVYPLDMQPHSIRFDDIAHALSMKCRWGGHTNQFYSVAQHSCIVAYLCLDVGGAQLAAKGLLHDAAEAYLPDVAAPIKHRFQIDGESFSTVEDRLLRKIYDALGVAWPTHGEWEQIKHADLVALRTEARDLMHICDSTWGQGMPDPMRRPDIPHNPAEMYTYFHEIALRVGLVTRALQRFYR